ncbi:LAFA_0A02410g1_1 [Lachancea sp. 'fantastica']|nr:LAFA_0A02410g1_1 [Lachancea sp. 'fantastica']
MFSENAVTLDTQLSTNLAKYHTALSKISSISQLSKLQTVIANDQTATQKSLDEYLQTSHNKLNQNVRKLELQRTKLTQTLTKLHHALEDIFLSKDLAVAISARIKSVDRERKLVVQTLQFVNHIQVLKRNVLTVHEAIERSDNKLAATGIDTILNLPPNVIESRFAAKVVPSAEIPENPADLVKLWTAALAKNFQDKFERAADSQNIEELTSVFQLFPLIRKSELGLDLYSKYVCNIISTQSRKIMTGSTPTNTQFYAKALLHLFKIVSTIINEHSKIIAECYGKQHMVHIMTKVQREADMQAGLILDSFLEARNFDGLLEAIREFERSANAPEETKSEAPSIASISSTLSEYSTILQNWSMYCRFFALKWYEFSDIQVSDGKLELPSPISKGNFYLKIHGTGFLDGFKKLMDHYLHSSFAKMVSLESLPPLNQFITKKPYKHDDISSYAFSSIVEDLTLLLRTCLILNVNTGQSSLMSDFLGILKRFLQNEYLMKFLQHNLRLLQPRLVSAVGLKQYIPHSDSNSTSRAASPGVIDPSKLSNLRFNLKGAASSAFSNIQSNLQAVYADEDSVLKLHHYLVYVNTLGVGREFLQRLLTKELLQDNPKLLCDNFPFELEAQTLHEAVEAAESNLLVQNDKLLNWAVKQLFENILQPKVRKMLGSLFIQGPDDEYVCSAVDFEDMSNLQQFGVDWNNTMIPYSNVLYKRCHVQLLSCIVDFVVAQIGTRLWNLQVNELGTIKLDRELSSLIAIVCEDQYALREKFTKLSQIVLVMGLEDDDFDPVTRDVKPEIISDINWALTPAERTRAQGLRVDGRR